MALPRLRSIVCRLRVVLLAVAVTCMVGMDLSAVTIGFAKDVDVIGTVDCGLRSGRRCDLGDTVVLWSDSITGTNELLTIDISWIRDKLPALDQDDEITLSVDVLPNGKLQALSVISATKRSGTMNPGLSTGSKQRGESRSDRGAQQDQDDPQNTAIARTPGTLTGTVRSLIGGAPVAGATVRVTGFTALTDVTGTFSIPAVDSGNVTATATAPGFIAQSLPVTISPNSVSTLSFLLATAFPDITFTLVWGAQPPDLDVHLSGPATGGGRFHAFFLVPNPETYVSLTVQDDDGFGPEQMVIRRNPLTGLYVPGEYHFWVHNFLTTPEYNVSQARVVVNKDGQLLGIFDASSAAGDPALDLWYVANVVIDGAGNATVVPVQQFTAGDSSVILRPPYGQKTPRPR